MNATKETKGPIVGIDLGTTNSAVALSSNGQITVAENSQGFRTTPSVVYYSIVNDSLKATVGSEAVSLIGQFSSIITSSKKKMGENYSFQFEVDGKKFSKRPEEVGADILTKLVNDSSEKLGFQVKRAVITVPAYFNNEQREATKRAGEIAGLEVVRIINEPTAAAIAYGLQKDSKGGNVIVYDLGGGTFDVSVLNIEKAKTEGEDNFLQVLATSGINDLGGDDYDREISNLAIKSFESQNSVSLSGKGDEAAVARIIQASRAAKHTLSSSPVATINVPFVKFTGTNTLNLNFQLTLSKFVELTGRLTKKTIDKVDEVLREAKLTPSEIDRVLLVGGSTRMPVIKEKLIEKFGPSKISSNLNPDEVVAIGAAVQGSVISGDISNLTILDVTPLSLGIETSGGVFTVLIKRNSSIPTSEKQTFSTAVDNQPEVTIKIGQGERPLASQNKTIGIFSLDGIKPAPRGVPKIEVTFSIDTNGTVSVSAKDLDSGKERSLEIKGDSTLSKEEVERMVQEAEENRERDQIQLEEIKTLDQSESYLRLFKDQVTEIRAKKDFDPEDSNFKQLEEEVSSLEKAINDKDYQILKEKNDKIQQIFKISEELRKKNDSDQDSNSSASTTEGSDSSNSSENETENESSDDSSDGI